MKVMKSSLWNLMPNFLAIYWCLHLAAMVEVAVGQSTNNPDMVALLSFKRNLVQSSTQPLSNWLAKDSNPCKWTGVVCNGTSSSTGRVTQLSLTNLGLTGSISPSLGNLSHLQSLDLSFNQLTGAIPSELSKLQKLIYLSLDSNSDLSGDLPLSLFNLTNLRYMYLNQNNFNGTISPQIAQLVHISELYLDTNSFTGVIPEAIGKLGATLTILNLSGNSLQGDIPWVAISNLTKLQKLDLSGNSLTGTIPKELGYLTALNFLTLRGNLLHGEIPMELSKCTNLTYLSLGRSSPLQVIAGRVDPILSGPIPSSFGALINLQVLEISYTQINGTIPDALASCTNLQVVRIAQNLLTGQIPSSFKNLTNMISFDVSSNALDGTLPSWIAGWKNLTTLVLSSNQLTGGIPQELINQCRMLQYLEVGWNNLNDTLPSALCVNNSQLLNLVLSNNHIGGWVTDQLQQCKNLTLLDLSANVLQGDILDFFYDFPSLVYLDLSTNNFTGRLPESLFHIPVLQYVDLSQNNLSGEISQSIGNLSSLQILNLDNNAIGGSIPPDVGALAVLQFLSIENNTLTGVIPSELANCSNLAAIYLGRNSLTGSIPPELGNSSTLVNLVLSYNNLSGEIPRGLSFRSSNLLEEIYHHMSHVLDLSYNHLSGSIPVSIATSTAGLWNILLTGNNLSGNIPSEFGSLANLVTLDLSDNNFTGSIPPELENCISLQVLNLAGNSFDGQIPVELGRLKQLRQLNLSQNLFSGNIVPACLGGLTQLTYLDLSENFFSGEFDRNLSNMTAIVGLHLQGNSLSGTLDNLLIHSSFWKSIAVLNLQRNMIHGIVPTALANLVSLKALNLSYNNLTGNLSNLDFANFGQMVSLDLSHNHFGGEFPTSVCDVPNLNAFNISNNNLAGLVPYTGSCTKMNSTSFLINPALCGRPVNKTCSTRSKDVLKAKGFIIGMTSATAFLLGCLIVLVIMICHNRSAGGDDLPKCDDRGSKGSSDLAISVYSPNDFANGSPRKEHLSINVATFAQTLQRLTMGDILEATNGFSEQNLIGEGGFGRVYKGLIPTKFFADHPPPQRVAIKKLGFATLQGDREFFAEMETLGKVKHANLVPLLGYCSFGDEKLLMYEYMPNGSLDYWLRHQSHLLEWPKRLHIIVGTAQGLCFLHHMFIPHIIHRDMKPSNILLDENLNARLADFGLARLISAYDTHVSTDVAGTFGYIPPEYGQFCRSTTRGDVYSFGVILLELITGREPTGNTEVEGGNLVDLVRSMVRSNSDPLELLDSSVIASSAQCSITKTAIFQALHIAIMCTCDDPSKRPSMMEVVKLLRNLQDNYNSIDPTLPLSDNEDDDAESLLVFDCNSKSVMPPESPGRI